MSPALYILFFKLTDRATLIARLISADTTGQLPPVPPVKAPGKQARRSVSTSRVAQKAKDEEPKPGDVTHTAGDAPIHAPTSGKSPEPVAEEIAASHPGLPIKEKTTSAPIDIKIPKHRDPKEDPQVIVSIRCNCSAVHCICIPPLGTGTGRHCRDIRQTLAREGRACDLI